MNLIFRPIDVWTDPETQNRRPGAFYASWTDTMNLLDREVDLLANGGRLHTEAVLQVNAAEGNMRRDGGIRADAKVRHPGVVLSFETKKHGPMRFACDRFEAASKYVNGSYTRTPAWQMNVRAIALGLEALRTVDRYGITKTGEQYTGWKQLGSGIAMPATQMTADEAAAFVASISGDPNLGGFEVLQQWAEYGERYYRDAAKQLHPDAGGSTADFQKLQEAKRLLDGLAS